MLFVGGRHLDGSQFGAAPLVEVEPLPPAAIGLSRPRAALVEQAARRGNVEEAKNAFGLADARDVKVVLGSLRLAGDLGSTGIGRFSAACAASFACSLEDASNVIRSATNTEATVTPKKCGKDG